MRAGPGRDSISGEWVPQVSSAIGVTGARNGAFANGSSRHENGGAAYPATVHRKSASASTYAAAAAEQQGPDPLFGGPLRSIDSDVMASGDIGSALASAGGTPLGGGGGEASHRGLALPRQRRRRIKLRRSQSARRKHQLQQRRQQQGQRQQGQWQRLRHDSIVHRRGRR